MGRQRVSYVFCISTVLLLDNKTVLVKSDSRTGRNKTCAPGIEMLSVCDVCQGRYCYCEGRCTKCVEQDELYCKMKNEWRAQATAEKYFEEVICRTKCTGKRNAEHIVLKPDTSHSGNGVHQGLFAGTLTMSPDDKYNEEDMVGAIKKIFAQQTVPVKKWAWYREYTKNGTPHIHFVYETESGGRIHKKIFQRYWKLWDEPRNQTGRGGFPGGYHSPAKSPTAYIEYISKDGGRRAFKGFEVQNEILMDK